MATHPLPCTKHKMEGYTSRQRDHNQPPSKTSVIARFHGWLILCQHHHPTTAENEQLCSFLTAVVDHTTTITRRHSHFNPKTTTTRGRNPKYEHSCLISGFRLLLVVNFIIFNYIIFNLIYQTRQTRGCRCGLGTGDSKSTCTRTRATHTWIPARVYKPMTGPTPVKLQLYTMYPN